MNKQEQIAYHRAELAKLSGEIEIDEYTEFKKAKEIILNGLARDIWINNESNLQLEPNDQDVLRALKTYEKYEYEYEEDALCNELLIFSRTGLSLSVDEYDIADEIADRAQYMKDVQKSPYKKLVLQLLQMHLSVELQNKEDELRDWMDEYKSELHEYKASIKDIKKLQTQCTKLAQAET